MAGDMRTLLLIRAKLYHFLGALDLLFWPQSSRISNRACAQCAALVQFDLGL
jgi:hypothetical protein